MKRKLILSSIISSFLTFSALLTVTYLMQPQVKSTVPIQEPSIHSTQLKSFSNPNQGGINLVDAAENSLNSVVHIKTQSIQEGAVSYNPFGELFFDTPYQKQPDQHLSGSGSGVIISSDGYIATNYHVIKGADEISISMNNHEEFQAQIIGTDPNTDLALLKIEGKDLPAIKYGNSNLVKVGEWVLAVGNPFNLTSTVTAGIVSAKGRNINLLKEQYAVESFIQTDAAVNPGNSGGALVNGKGELIGINTAIASNTGSYTGYSFAVPVNLVQKVMNDLRDYGKVQRALLGVKIRDIDSDLMNDKNLNTLNGVYVEDVFENTAAEKANLKKGDVLLLINESEINSVASLQETISAFGPGDEIKITFQRDGKIKAVDVTLKNSKGTTALVKKDEVILGAIFEKLSKSEKAKLNLKNGLKINTLQPGKLRSAGIKQGFIVTHLDKNEINSVKQLAQLLNNKKGGVLLQGCYPNGQKAYYGFGL